MQNIVVKFHPQVGVKSGRYSATTSSGIRVFWENDHSMSSEANQDAAFYKLCERVRWSGTWIRGGRMRDGQFVYVPVLSSPKDQVELWRYE